MNALTLAMASLWLLSMTIALILVVLVNIMFDNRRRVGYLSYVNYNRILHGMMYLLLLWALVSGCVVYIYAERFAPVIVEFLLRLQQ